MAAAAADGFLAPNKALAQLAASDSSVNGTDMPHVVSGLQAGPGQPPIIARRAWAHGGAHPKVAPEYGRVELAFVHHTENPDGYSAAEVPEMLRSIFAFHRYTHGWNDIGYNFVIDRFGRIFEARAGGIDEPVTGAHAGGYNAYSTGIAILGTYGAQRISPAALTALEHLLAWKLSLHGAPVEGRVTVRVTPEGAVYSRFPANTPVSLPRVAGHRDADSTDCPGDALYGELSLLRRRAALLAGHPASATLLSQTANPVDGAQAALTGSLRFLDGTPVVGAPIEIRHLMVARKGEAVTESVVAHAVTGADGRWLLPIMISSATAKTTLRAVSAGGPNPSAAVSDTLPIAGTVSFSAPVAPAPEEAPAPSAPGSPPPAT
jgi:uncharacterized protein with LGFP repeats